MIILALRARVRYFILGDHEKARQFLVKYQDRVLYATDYTLKPGDDTSATRALRQTEDQDWKFFASSEPIQFRGKPYQGSGLPYSVARKIFHDNAVRWLPGIVRHSGCMPARNPATNRSSPPAASTGGSVLVRSTDDRLPVATISMYKPKPFTRSKN